MPKRTPLLFYQPTHPKMFTQVCISIFVTMNSELSNIQCTIAMKCKTKYIILLKMSHLLLSSIMPLSPFFSPMQFFASLTLKCTKLYGQSSQSKASFVHHHYHGSESPSILTISLSLSLSLSHGGRTHDYQYQQWCITANPPPMAADLSPLPLNFFILNFLFDSKSPPPFYLFGLLDLLRFEDQGFLGLRV